MFKTLKLDRWFFLYSTKKLRFEWVLKLTKHGANSENLIIFFMVEWVFIETALHRMAYSSNAQFHLVFKTVSRICVALLHQKLLMIWWE